MRRTAAAQDRSLRARALGAGLAALAVLTAVACEPSPGEPGSPSTPTTVSSTTTSTTAGEPTTSTTSTVPTTSSTTSTTTSSTTSTSTTTTAPEAPDGLTLTDTGLTRVRVELTSEAAWVALELRGMHIDVSRVVSTGGSMTVTGLGGREIGAVGAGSAVIDLVLSIPEGASTSLSMCKNYTGPATARLIRLTDDATEIASLTNTGDATVVPPGECENHRETAIARSALIGPVRWPARRDPRPLVLGGYYPWYDAQNLQHHFGDQPIGPANTDDPEQVAAAVALAADSGLDGFTVEYEASAPNNARIDLVYAAADAHGDFRLALVVDFAIMRYRPGGLTGAGLDAALDMVAELAGRPSQLEVQGEPVVFVYGAWLPDPAAWAAALDRLEERTGLQPFVITDSAALPSPGAYEYGTHHLATEPELQQWAVNRRISVQEQPGIYGEAGPLWVAPVTPGYDDRLLGRLEPRLVPRNGGLRYEQTWDAALATLPDWILVTSWNEYYEQTHIMPGTLTGHLALQQTEARAEQFHVTG